MVSVIIAYDKNRGCLDKCIQSIKNQNYGDIEIIQSQSPNPVGYNFNRGLERAKGEYVKYVDEDDWLPGSAITDLMEGIGDHPWICANAYHVGVETTVVKSIVPTFEQLIKHNSIHGGTTLFRTDILREVGGMDEELQTGEEWDMYLKLYLKGYFPGYIDKEVYYYRIWFMSKSRRHRDQQARWRVEQLDKIRMRYDPNYVPRP